MRESRKVPDMAMNDDFRAACVIGWPAGHSRSPLIHNYWIKQHRMAAEYRREAVPPEEFAGFIASWGERGYVGANVTLPHKEAALRLSRPDDRASAVGAANTLWLEGGVLRSTNTDVEGFTENLDAAAPGWDAGLASALVLGAGGAARAVVFALLERGAGRVYVANRTAEKAEAFRARFGNKVQPLRWSDIDNTLGDVRLLANATSLGMTGQPELQIDVARLSPHAVVTDIVYVPLETHLLAAARKRGLRTADGLGMLLHQAVRGFSLWFGVRPEVTAELRALVEGDLRAGVTAEK
jgi:shikimate dehydrogenase